MDQAPANLDVYFEFLEPSEPDTIRMFAINRLPFIVQHIGKEVP